MKHEDPEVAASNERKVRQQFWPKLRRVLQHVPFARDLVAAYYCALDPQTPFRAKAMLLGALAYFILPIDAIPDFILGAGFTDDAAVLALAIKVVADHIRPEHREAADTAIGGDRQA